MKHSVAAIFCLSLAATAFAQDAIEARLKKLEDEVAELKKENGQLRRDLGQEVGARQTAVKMSGRAEAVQIGGLIQAQTEAGDRGDTRFSDSNARAYLRRARVNLSGRFVEEFNFRAELELAGSVANTSGFRAQLTDAYLNWNRFDAANIRIGQFKTPFGFEQLYADPRLYTLERSLVNDRLTPGRQIGAQIGGALANERINYSAGLFNGSGTNQNFNDNDRFMMAGRASVVPFRGRLLTHPSRWSIGVDRFRSSDANVPLASEFGLDSTPGTPAKDSIFAGRRSGLGYDTQLEAGPFELWAEYLREAFQPADRLPSRTFRSDGWYVQASYYLVSDRLQLVERLETFDPSSRAAGDATRSSIFGVNWYLKQHDLKLQLDWMRSSAPGLLKEQQKVLARIQTVF